MNLDGPDRIKFNWHDLRKEQNILYKDQGRGGSVMIRAYFSFWGKSILMFLEGRQASANYFATLQNNLLEFIDLNLGESWKCQHANVPLHVSRLTKQWLDESKFITVRWPARSPEVNPIERLWELLSRCVYRNVGSLKALTLWNRLPVRSGIPLAILCYRILCFQCESAYVEVLKSNEGKIDYWHTICMTLRDIHVCPLRGFKNYFP